MKVEHIAVGYNSEEEADKFFINLLGLKKVRSKLVAADLMNDFFGVKDEYKFIIYSSNQATFEVFITNDKSRAQDIFTHSCLLVENRDELLTKASSMGYDVVKVPRKDGNGYYLFIRDSFRNLYEIKEE
ncbi:MAG: VOC family protein [Candidatus Lokiarchaeota archaeon]|nr:VOC family protein [Candidatus Lokiarchaeota archaeon]